MPGRTISSAALFGGAPLPELTARRPDAAEQIARAATSELDRLLASLRERGDGADLAAALLGRLSADYGAAFTPQEICSDPQAVARLAARLLRLALKHDSSYARAALPVLVLEEQSAAASARSWARRALGEQLIDAECEDALPVFCELARAASGGPSAALRSACARIVRVAVKAATGERQGLRAARIARRLELAGELREPDAGALLGSVFQEKVGFFGAYLDRRHEELIATDIRDELNALPYAISEHYHRRLAAQAAKALVGEHGTQAEAARWLLTRGGACDQPDAARLAANADRDALIYAIYRGQGDMELSAAALKSRLFGA